jgi:hypothetical protein
MPNDLMSFEMTRKNIFFDWFALAFLGRGSSTLLDAVSHTIVGYLVVIITIAGYLSLSSIKVGFF